MDSRQPILHDLLKNTVDVRWIAEILEDKNVEVSFFEQSKAELLEIYEVFLANNMELGIVVSGLKETVQRVRESKFDSILVNGIDGAKNIIVVYTDPGHSVVLGVVQQYGSL